MIEALDIHVQGIVQGVGFRPFVFRMAKKYLINGWVLNAADGVFIHAEGESQLLDEFVMELSDNAPAAAQVKQIELKEVPLEGFDNFEIRFSAEGEVEQTTLVSPELATCEDCLREMANPNDRRYHYPFVNCTNCGPRFTIIESLPYDRKSTSMREFEMCDRCAAEYADPGDRRFHAQPDACFDCGPVVTWYVPDACDACAGDRKALSEQGALDEQGAPNTGAVQGSQGVSTAPSASSVRLGRTLAESDAIFAEAAEMLAQGKIVAVKGLGGYHLMCDARNARAVETLRARKRREGKAFAVMMKDAAAVREVCEVNEVEEALLSGAQRPIVLLKKRAGVSLAPRLADGLSELGVMLPYTPVQHLLLEAFAQAKSAVSPAGEPWGAGAPMLVATSGNVHDEPIAISNSEAYTNLAGIADAFLGNNRVILTRFDDSVMRVVKAGSAGFALQFVRRARGYAPSPVALDLVKQAEKPKEKPGIVFATGPEQKNTFTLLRGSEAFVSQHVGDMENAETYNAWFEAKRRFESLFELEPQVVACDMHPEYLTSKWAHAQELPVCEVQHHHAHIVSAMAENGLTDAVCGIAFDGTGYGVDGSIWGGEVLLANLQDFERFANFAYAPMPGGAAAIKHPLRMAYGVLWAFDLLEHPAAVRAIEALGDQAALCERMIEQGINTPMTSSLGRLFDAASALLGVCTEPAYEGEGAIALEAAIGSMADQAPAADAAANSAANVAVGAAADAPAGASAESAQEALERYAVAITKNVATPTSTARDTSVVLLDAAPTFRALLDDMQAGVPVALIARRFHEAIIGAVEASAQLVRAVYGISTVVLSGGVFMNRYLLEGSLDRLERAGFAVAVNRDLPPNDGCISVGQAVVAWAQNQHTEEAPAASVEGAEPAASPAIAESTASQGAPMGVEAAANVEGAANAQSPCD